MQDTIILLLSKYSDNCNKLMQIMKSSNITFDFIDTIFIDNVAIRKSILKKKSYNITSVPTILVFKQNEVEKYDNDFAFRWINETIKNISNENSLLNQMEAENEINNIDIEETVQQKVNEKLEDLKIEMQQQLQEQLNKKDDKPVTDINSLLNNSTLYEEDEELDFEMGNKLAEKSVKKDNSMEEKIKEMEKERNQLFSEQNPNKK